MRKFYCSFLFAVAIASSFDVKAQSVNHLVISQVYGGGGNSGAPYSNDFVELFNPTANTISLSGMSIQYASSTGTSWTNKVNLTGSVGAGKYFLIQLASTNTLVGSALPTPDLIGTINMSGTSGKVALMNSTISMTGSGCPIASPIIDFVGYGSADCSEGSSPVAALSNTAAAIRKSNGCTDTDNNSSDFSTGAPVPRNSTSAANICGILTPTIGVTSTSLTGFTTTTGVQSASQTVAITGMNLNDLSLITIVATSPYEISVNNSDFSTFAVLQSINGFVSGAINIRISASAPAGAANGSVTISYNGATYFT